MGLRDVIISKTTVNYREQSFDLRGISATDVMLAAQDYGPQMALAFAKVTAGDAIDDTQALILDVVKELPELVAAVIAMAADDYDPKVVKIAKSLPFNTQVECVEAIFSETFYNEAEVKKLIESLTRMIAAISGALTDVTPQLSAIGTGLSDAK